MRPPPRSPLTRSTRAPPPHTAPAAKHISSQARDRIAPLTLAWRSSSLCAQLSGRRILPPSAKKSKNRTDAAREQRCLGRATSAANYGCSGFQAVIETMGADLSHSRSVQAAMRGVRAYSKSAPPSFGVEKNRDAINTCVRAAVTVKFSSRPAAPAAGLFTKPSLAPRLRDKTRLRNVGSAKRNGCRMSGRSILYRTCMRYIYTMRYSPSDVSQPLSALSYSWTSKRTSCSSQIAAARLLQIALKLLWCREISASDGHQFLLCDGAVRGGTHLQSKEAH